MTARLWLGGELLRSRAYRLVLAVRSASISAGTAGWEDVICRPRSIEGLLEALTSEGHLHLQGEPERLQPIIETTVELGLSYRFWSDGILEVWDIDVPFRLHAPRPDEFMVEHAAVREGIELLRAGDGQAALLVLESVCPEIPALSPLRITQD